MNLAISTFKNKLDRSPRDREVTWEALSSVLTQHVEREGKDGPAWSPTRYKPGTTRGKAHVEELSCLVLDFDQGGGPEVWGRRLKGYAAVMHTTHHHHPEAERWRVVLPLLRPVKAEEWPAVWNRLTKRLGVTMDASCKDAGRLYYTPSCPPGAEHQAILREGEWLDPEGGLRPSVEVLIEQARERLGEGRNNAGLFFACQLRDNGFSQGEAERADWDRHVPREKTRPDGTVDVYDREEWRETVRKVYSTGPREPWTRGPNGRHPPEEEDPPGIELPPVVSSRFTFLSFDELCALPPPRYHVEEFFLEESLVQVFGATSHGKSLLCWDLCCSLCLGAETWFGKPINRHGPVVWVNADGGRGLTLRAKAWRAANGGALAYPLHTLMGAVALNRPDQMRAFYDQIMGLDERPCLIVLDTQSRCMVGAKENDAEEMTRLTDSLHRLKMDAGCTVLPIHHANKLGETERGSGVVVNEADTQIRVTKDPDSSIFTVSCTKGRDHPEWRDFYFKLQPVEESVVIVQEEWGGQIRTPQQAAKDTAKQDLLDLIRQVPGRETDNLTDLLGLKSNTCRRYLAELEAAGLVVRQDLPRQEHRPGRALQGWFGVPGRLIE